MSEPTNPDGSSDPNASDAFIVSTPLTVVSSSTTPSTTPSSTLSAKEKEEARRKRILNATSARLNLARGEIVSLNPEIADEPQIEKERPLAARRNRFRQAKSLNTSNDSNADGDSVDTDKAVNADDNDKISIPLNEPDSNSSNSSSSSSSQKGFIPSRTKSIEEEIARCTKEHDDKVLSKESNKAKDAKNIELLRLKAKMDETNPLKTTDVMRIVRFFLTLLLAAGTCYYSNKPTHDSAMSLVMRSKSLRKESLFTHAAVDKSISSLVSVYDRTRYMIEKTVSFISSSKGISIPSFADLSGDEWLSGVKISTDSIDSLASFVADARVTNDLSVDKKDKSWMTWLIKSNIEYSFNAMGIIWWIASTLQPFIHTMVQKKIIEDKKKSDMLSKIFNLFVSGFGSMYEYIYEVVGEISVYAMMIIVISLVVQYIHSQSYVSPSDTVNDSGIASDSINNINAAQQHTEF